MIPPELVTAVANPDADVTIGVWPAGIGGGTMGQEWLVKAADLQLVNAPPAPVPDVLYALATTNVRQTPALTGTLLGQLKRGDKVGVLNSVAADGHTWGKIVQTTGDGKLVGGYVARDVLSTTAPL